MSDYAVKVAVRNGRILRRMKQVGIPSMKELSRQAGVDYEMLNGIVTFRIPPVRNNGQWRAGVTEIAIVLQCDPEDLFSPAQMQMRLATNRREVFIEETEMAALVSNGALEDSVWLKIEAERLLGFLTNDRDRYVVEERMNGRTQQDIANEKGWEHSYVGQVEQRAYTVMKKRAMLQNRDVGRHIRFSD